MLNRIQFFFEKLSSLTTLLKESCAQENLLSDAYKNITERFIKISNQLAAAAKKETDGKPLTDDDAIFLGALNRDLSSIVYIPGRSLSSEEKKMALIADVSTDFLTGAILHVGVGEPPG